MDGRRSLGLHSLGSASDGLRSPILITLFPTIVFTADGTRSGSRAFFIGYARVATVVQSLNPYIKSCSWWMASCAECIACTWLTRCSP